MADAKPHAWANLGTRVQELETRFSWQDDQIDFLRQRLKNSTDEISRLERLVLVALFAGLFIGYMAGGYGV